MTPTDVILSPPDAYKEKELQEDAGIPPVRDFALCIPTYFSIGERGRIACFRFFLVDREY
jgi:hypothetical protein